MLLWASITFPHQECHNYATLCSTKITLNINEPTHLTIFYFTCVMSFVKCPLIFQNQLCELFETCKCVCTFYKLHYNAFQILIKIKVKFLTFSFILSWMFFICIFIVIWSYTWFSILNTLAISSLFVYFFIKIWRLTMLLRMLLK